MLCFHVCTNANFRHPMAVAMATKVRVQSCEKCSRRDLSAFRSLIDHFDGNRVAFTVHNGPEKILWNKYDQAVFHTYRLQAANLSSHSLK